MGVKKSKDIHILGLVGSPRKNHHTDILVQAVLNGAYQAGAQVTKIYLNDLRINPCQACFKHPYPKYCFFNDGMNKLYKFFETVDGVVLGTPAYYETISSQTKLMIDRCNCLSMITRIDNKKILFTRRIKKPKLGVFIWVADCSTNLPNALWGIKRWLADVNLSLFQTITFLHSERYTKPPQKLQKTAEKVGKLLVGRIKAISNSI
ncbi:MAG: flavodoxin family protein [candidate division WOR-3 bacterium]